MNDRGVDELAQRTRWRRPLRRSLLVGFPLQRR
jgi:hypothetical protein